MNGVKQHPLCKVCARVLIPTGKKTRWMKRTVYEPCTHTSGVSPYCELPGWIESV